MANTTFSGPVISKNGFTSTGPGMTVSLTADTTLTVASHAGRILLCNDADGKFTLPSINVNSNGATAGLFTFMWKQLQLIWTSKQMVLINLKVLL